MLAATTGAGNVEALSGIFPGRDPHELRQALEAHQGNMERAVEYLLSPQNNTAGVQSSLPLADRDAPRSNIVYETGDSVTDGERARQLAEDEQLAQRLQIEEQMQYVGTNEGETAGLGGQDWSMQSGVATLQETVGPLVEKSKSVGRSVINRLQNFYHEYLEEDPAPEHRQQPNYTVGNIDTLDDEPSVLRASVRSDDAGGDSLSHRMGKEGTRRRTASGLSSKKD